MHMMIDQKSFFFFSTPSTWGRRCLNGSLQIEALRPGGGRFVHAGFCILAITGLGRSCSQAFPKRCTTKVPTSADTSSKVHFVPPTRRNVEDT